MAVLIHAAIQGLRLLQPGSGDTPWPLEFSPGSPVSAQRMRQGKEITRGPRLSSHLPSRPPQAAPDPKHLTTEEAEECSLALNLGRKRSQRVENRQLFARAHTCTHTHVYTCGLSSPPPNSCWCRALCTWPLSTQRNIHPAAALRALASLRPSSRVTAHCWVDSGLLVTAFHFIPPLSGWS